MKSKNLTWLLVLVMLLGLLALYAPAATPTAASPAEQTDEKPFAGQELTMIYFDATYARAAEAVIPEFEEKTGAKVTLVTAPYASLYEKEFTDLVTSGGAYDNMQVASQWDGQFAPYLASIEDYLANDPDVKIDDFIPGVARVTGIWDEVRFGIPNADDAYGIIYRTDIFEQEGNKVDPLNWTWDEYAALAKQLTKDDMYGTAIAFRIGEGVQGWEWEKVYTRKKTDKATEQVFSYNGLPVARLTGELEPVYYADMSENAATTFTVQKFTLASIVSRELQMNNLHLPDFMKELGSSAGESQQYVRNISAAAAFNRAFNSSYTLWDGNELCDSRTLKDGTTFDNDLTPAPLTFDNLWLAVNSFETSIQSHAGLYLVDKPK